MTEIDGDWWTESSPELWQPKADIAEYVESEGFTVPRRFPTLEDALGHVSGDSKILIRSEHPDEYDGPSGLLFSHTISRERIESGRHRHRSFGSFNIDDEITPSFQGALMSNSVHGGKPGYGDVLETIISDVLSQSEDTTINRLREYQENWDPLQRYMDLAAYNPEAFMDGFSFSYWEHINGSNVAMVADDAVDDRYHFFINGLINEQYGRYIGGVVANEGGEIERKTESGNDSVSSVVLSQLIDTYEGIRNLQRFDSEHCPIMELQIGRDGETYFLQTHRSRNFSNPSIQLDSGDFDETWAQVDYTRGSTDGIQTVNAALWYPRGYGSSRTNSQPRVYPLPEHEDASFDWHYDIALSEILSRRRDVYFSVRGFEYLYGLLADRHDSRSKWVKSAAALVIPRRTAREIISEPLKEIVSSAVHRDGKMARLAIQVATDGQKGFMRLNPDADPVIFTEN